MELVVSAMGLALSRIDQIASTLGGSIKETLLLASPTTVRSHQPWVHAVCQIFRAPKWKPPNARRLVVTTRAMIRCARPSTVRPGPAALDSTPARL